MAREVNLENPSTEDLAYLSQRSWLVRDAELEGHATLRAKVEAFLSGEELEEEEEEEEELLSYSEATVAQLKEELKSRGLEVSGPKDELIARLEADDEK